MPRPFIKLLVCAALLQTAALAPVRAAEEPRVYAGVPIEQLVQRMKDFDPLRPTNAQLVPPLVALVVDAGAPLYQRRTAAMTLGRIGPAAQPAVAALARVLAEETPARPETLTWAAGALATFGPRAKDAAPALLAFTHDRQIEFVHRRAAFEALAQIGAAHPDVIPGLIEHLTSRPEAPTDAAQAEAAHRRETAAIALGIIGPDAAVAVPLLARAAGDSREEVRRHALAALAAMEAKAEVAIPTLTESLVFDPSEAVRDVAAHALAATGPAGTAALEGLLAHDDPGVRWRAAQGLGRQGAQARTAVRAVTAAQRDPDPHVRIEADEALWKITGQASLVAPALVEQLASEDRTIRMRALGLLTSLGPDLGDAPQRLRTLLSDPRDYVRQTAAKALEKIAPDQR